MLGHFHTVLDGIVATPGERLAALLLLTAAERQHVAHQNQRVRPPHPFVVLPKTALAQSLTDRFVQQVQRFPNNIAVKTKQGAWTYAALNHRANRIARTLLTHARVAEERIALLFDHDAPMIAALLGELKAGKTYVPLDPSYPKERLVYMLEDA